MSVMWTYTIYEEEGGMNVEEAKTGKEGVSRAEFEVFKKALLKEAEDMKDMVCAVAKELREPKQVGIYRCSEEGCTYVTDDLGEFIEHTIDERMQKLAPTQEMIWEEEKPKIGHSTVKDYLDCPECFPKAVDALLEHPKFQQTLKERGWEKPEPKRKGLNL